MLPAGALVPTDGVGHIAQSPSHLSCHNRLEQRSTQLGRTFSAACDRLDTSADREVSRDRPPPGVGSSYNLQANLFLEVDTCMRMDAVNR